MSCSGSSARRLTACANSLRMKMTGGKERKREREREREKEEGGGKENERERDIER